MGTTYVPQEIQNPQDVAGMNANFNSIEASMDEMLSRLGTAPNQMNSVIDMNSNRIVNLPSTPASNLDAVSKLYVDTFTAGSVTAAAASAAEADEARIDAEIAAAASQTSAGNSQTSSINSGTSAANALTSETNAAASAAAALVSENNAATSETNAGTSETNAAQTLEDFSDIYYGPLAGDPALAPSGAASTAGDLYFSTTTDEMQEFTGVIWQPISTGLFITDADNIIYDNTTSGLTAVDVQAAIDEVSTLSGSKNFLFDPAFTVNQRAVSGTVVLSSGEYGHDRWRGGSSGCTYTFAISSGLTTITISAGTLEQEIEGDDIESLSSILSWVGTAQGQIDGGGFGSSGVTATVFGGSNATVEFNTGTLTNVQLEEGTSATDFEFRSIGEELLLCQRYYHRVFESTGAVGVFNFSSWNGTYGIGFLPTPVLMRAPATLTFASNLDFTVNIAGLFGSPTNLVLLLPNTNSNIGQEIQVVTSLGSGGQSGWMAIDNASGGFLALDAEL